MDKGKCRDSSPYLHLWKDPEMSSLMILGRGGKVYSMLLRNDELAQSCPCLFLPEASVSSPSLCRELVLLYWFICRASVLISAKFLAIIDTRQLKWMKVLWQTWGACLKPKLSTYIRRWPCTRTPQCCPACRWSLTSMNCSVAHLYWSQWAFNSKNQVCIFIVNCWYWWGSGGHSCLQAEYGLMFWKTAMPSKMWGSLRKPTH